MRTLFSLLIIPLFCSTVCATRAGELLLAGFEEATALKKWELDNVTGEIVNLHEKEGLASAHLIFKARKEKASSSRALLKLDRSLIPKGDWMPYEELLFDVVNKSEQVIELRAGLTDEGGQRVASGTYLIRPQEKKTCKVPVSHIYRKMTTEYLSREEKGIDESTNVLNFYLLAIAENDLFLDNVRLVADEIAIKEADLLDDPFGTGQITVVCNLNRAAQCDAKVLGPGGTVLARHVALTDRLNWRWDDLAQLGTMPPGRYKVALTITDVKWQPDLPLKRSLGSFEIISNNEAANMVAWYVPSTRKVMLHSRPDRDASVSFWQEKGRIIEPEEPCRIEMARNEYEGAQVVFLTRDKTIRLNLRIESLRHKDTGKQFPMEGSGVFQVGYLKTRDPFYYEVDHLGWWPDALLPAEQMYAKPGECMPVWVNLRSRSETEPGLYRGQLVVSVNGVDVGSLPLEVRVYDVPIPTETTIRTAFATYDSLIEEIHGGTLAAGMLRKYHEFVADHRLNVDNIYRSTPPDIETIDYFHKRGQLNAFNLKYIGGRIEAKDRISSQAYLDSLAELLDPYVAELEKRGLAEKAYLYGFDEIGGEMYAGVKTVFGFLKQRYPQIPTMTTGRDPSFGVDSRLENEVDIWVPLTPAYDLELAQAARKRGKEVWWYICISPPHPYANWFIEYPALEARLIWWMTYQQKVPGFLYYLTNLRHGQSELMRLDGHNKTNWNPASWRTANGDGCFMYSGPDGPISTIRFENLRDGIEDTELLFLLENQLGDQGVEGSKYCGKLIKSLTEYTDDDLKFASVRRQILSRLEGIFVEKGER